MKELDKKIELIRVELNCVNTDKENLTGVYQRLEQLEQLVKSDLLHNVSNCEHDYEHYTNSVGETVAVCSKCLKAYF